MRWFDQAEHQATIGIAHLIATQYQPHLAKPAITLIEQAIPLRPAERVRSLAFDHIGLARAYTADHQLDATQAAATTAIELASQVGSTRLTDRLTELDTDLAALKDPTAERIRANMQAGP